MAIKKIIPYLKKYKKKIFLGFAFVSASNLLAVLIPKFVGKSVDLIASKSFSMDEVLLLIFGILFLTLASGFLMYLTRKQIIVVSRYVEYDLRKEFVAKISRRPFSFFTEKPTGELMSLATNDISAAREFIGPAIMYSANTVTTFVLVLIFMLSLDVQLTLLSLLPLPLITLTTYYIGARIHSIFKDVQSQFAELTTQAQETFSGIRLVKSYVREIYEAKRFEKLSEAYKKKNLKLEFFYSLMIPLLLVLIGISQLIVIGVGGYRVIKGTMTLGNVSQFFIYINILIWPVAAIGWVTNVIQRASASIARLWEIFEIEEEQIIIKKTADIKIKGKIDVIDVYFQYGSNLPFVIQGLNISIPAGSSLGILGPVGSGKSTFVKLLTGTYKPSRGKILIDGNDLNLFPKSSLFNSFAVVTQEPFIFSSTIRENINLGNPDATDEEILHFVHLAGLNKDVESFPEGINTIVGERGVTLSGGQKQRVAIARALIHKPKILILDDPFSSVDAETEAIILQNIFTELKTTTIIIVSNRISSIEGCDSIILLEDGTITEKGTHSELLKLEGKYYTIYQLQKLTEELDTN